MYHFNLSYKTILNFFLSLILLNLYLCINSKDFKYDIYIHFEVRLPLCLKHIPASTSLHLTHPSKTHLMNILLHSLILVQIFIFFTFKLHLFKQVYITIQTHSFLYQNEKTYSMSLIRKNKRLKSTSNHQKTYVNMQC